MGVVLAALGGVMAEGAAVSAGAAAAEGAASAGASEMVQNAVAANAASNIADGATDTKKDESKPKTSTEKESLTPISDGAKEAQEAQEALEEQNAGIASTVGNSIKTAASTVANSAKSRFSQAWNNSLEGGRDTIETFTNPQKALEDREQYRKYSEMSEAEKALLSDDEKTKYEALSKKHAIQERKRKQNESNIENAKQLFSQTLEASTLG